ncbi:phospholipid ABC transporter ATP-binding protein MlaF [Photobacterium alginatilyticum]|uniref:Phospholipid ABC transporter ATP-binding protein MlaF n=1 Tax=Photobacterium alginatilyticum TaxID=1775171 RepID=A0ABW9YK47_9GAMM|nr:phospholipid ABC transporter ATP-binding protein MlaF [Photobacterium alginatilyticum]NBI53598.1 phospholipid ABC transporter ATP-binding protein MlaF [Photobacterium alginatilyticum]
MEPTEALVSIKNMTFSRGERKIFDDVSLDVPKGKVTAIMGPSGIGKTTLLRLIGGQIQPDSGEVWFENWNIPTLSRRELYQARNRMSMLFQSGALFTDMTVFDNVAFPLREHTDLPEELLRTLVLLKLESVGLRGAAQLMPNELSGGMARRAALARAIALDPDLIMYDEPFVGQDPITMGVLVTLIRSMNQALGITSVIVSHDVPEVMSIADHVYLLSGGKVIGQGTPDELRANPDPQIRQFLDGDADGPVPFKYPAQALSEDLFGMAE